MKTASAAKIAAEFNDYLEVTLHQPVLITRNGKPVAMLLSVQDKADAEQLANRSRSLRSIFEQAHEQLERGGGIPHDQFWQELAESRRAKGRTAKKGSRSKAR